MTVKTKKKFPVLFKLAGIFLLLCVAAAGAVLIFISQNPQEAALFADSVLRPAIGSRSVIAVEGFAFGIQDAINHLFEHQPTKANYIVITRTVSIISHPTAFSPPTDIYPLVDSANPLAGEGKWTRISDTNLYSTFIRTDPTRLYSVVNLVFIPMKVFTMESVAGTKYPGGAFGKPGTGMVPLNIQQNGGLTAAFNGGFQEKDGHYGMFTNGTTYVPLKTGLATFMIYKDGHVAMSLYDGKPLPPDVVTARQNGIFLVTNGQTDYLTSEGIDLWAGTANGGYITWRSGIGVTKDGDVIYAVGPSLTPTTLADALRLAGCVTAMQLDINAVWVRFTLYTWNNQTKSYSWSPLVQGLTDGGSNFLQGYEKDFFYIYKKPIPTTVKINLIKHVYSETLHHLYFQY